MPVGGEQLVAGPYTCTWSGAAIGITEGEDGFPTLQKTPRAQRVENTDRWGKTLIDSVHLGAVAFFLARLMEYPEALPILWPFGLLGSTVGPIGALKYQLSRALVMTAVSGTTASDSPATLTMPKTIMADDFDVSLRYGPTVRIVPIKLDVYPAQLAPDQYGWFTMT